MTAAAGKETGLDFEKLSTVMRKLALEAGDCIMKIYNSDEFEVRSKSDQSPVTEADEAADALISAGLRSDFPDVLLVTEEQAASHSGYADRFLIVDPLDGTKEFVQRRGDFTVNIAMSKTERRSAALYMPRQRSGCSIPMPPAHRLKKPESLPGICPVR